MELKDLPPSEPAPLNPCVAAIEHSWSVAWRKTATTLRPFSIHRTARGWTIKDRGGKGICRDTSSQGDEESWNRGLMVLNALNAPEVV